MARTKTPRTGRKEAAAAPRTTRPKAPRRTPATLAAGAVATSAVDGGKLLVSGLALLALVTASGSLLFLVTRSGVAEARR